MRLGIGRLGHPHGTGRERRSVECGAKESKEQQPKVVTQRRRTGLERPGANIRRERRRGVEGRCAGKHAEALAEQVQGQAGARFLAHRDVAQQGFLVQLLVVDQAQVLRLQRGRGVVVRGQRATEARMMVHGQARIVTAERGRLIDRAWQATLNALRSFAGRSERDAEDEA